VFNAQKVVYLVLAQRPVAGCRSHHEPTDQLDLGLQVIVCELVIRVVRAVILGSGTSHAHNLPVSTMPALQV
jgi:hypothetical protein